MEKPKYSKALYECNARYARLKTRALTVRFTNSVENERLAYDYIKKHSSPKHYILDLVVADMQKDLIYKYGMKLRECGPGCQPKGFTKCENSKENSKDEDYYSYIWYERELSDDEIKQFDLDYLGIDLK